jgi:hypothetical protein
LSRELSASPTPATTRTEILSLSPQSEASGAGASAASDASPSAAADVSPRVRRFARITTVLE